jgi:hypothetical protein
MESDLLSEMLCYVAVFRILDDKLSPIISNMSVQQLPIIFNGKMLLLHILRFSCPFPLSESSVNIESGNWTLTSCFSATVLTIG